MKVLLTYFEPFAGRKINNSQVIAEILKFEGLKQNVIFTLQELPVIYDKAAALALDFFKQNESHSDLAISLGECNGIIRIETLLRNRDHTPELADNSDQIRTDTQIIAQAPDYLDITLPTQKMKESLSSEEQEYVIISEDAGSFVCNNTAFRIAHQKLNIPYGFIHVPHAEKKDAPSVSECALIILKMIKSLRN